MKTLVLGGYGNFGARLCRALAADPAIELLVAGRQARHAQAFADALGPSATGLGLDHGSDALGHALRAHDVALVIHAAGPFQAQHYHVAHAAARAGAHYLDLADGRRFVCDFPEALGSAFAQAQRVGLSGASTVPALSFAVVEQLCRDWTAVRSIDICIAPAQTATRGNATLAGTLSCCGEPVTVWDDGRWQPRTGWGELRREHFRRLRPRWGGLCDIPDLELMPARYAVRQRVMFRAAMEVGLSQRLLALLAALRRARLIPPPARWAGVLNRLGHAFDPFGSSLGGMVVRVAGVDRDGRSRRAAWHIAADHGHGPEIPCMPAILLARRLARGEAFPVGAFTAAGWLELYEFESEFARWGMVTDIDEEDDTDAA